MIPQTFPDVSAANAGAKSRCSEGYMSYINLITAFWSIFSFSNLIGYSLHED